MPSINNSMNFCPNSRRENVGHSSNSVRESLNGYATYFCRVRSRYNNAGRGEKTRGFRIRPVRARLTGEWLRHDLQPMLPERRGSRATFALHRLTTLR